MTGRFHQRKSADSIQDHRLSLPTLSKRCDWIAQQWEPSTSHTSAKASEQVPLYHRHRGRT
ncbi:Uncharacterised protein [Mycobacteroides abscessus subsp. abscessus]|nr:Uncharacterised protein [Mycobacteroides abscessus subsp. abscessus]